MKLQKKIPMIYPWDPDYDRVRYNVNRRFVFFPLAVIMCETTEQVVAWAKKHQLQVTVRELFSQ